MIFASGPLPNEQRGHDELAADPASERVDMKLPLWVTVVRFFVLTALVAACGAAPSAADLPRTTGQGIDLTVAISDEVLPLPGCHTQWLMNHDEEPPPGTCEQETTVRRFIAQHDGQTVEASVVGEANVDPLYAMGLASREVTEDLSVAVVVPPSDAAVVRLTDGSGLVLDEVIPSGDLIALAGLGTDLTVEAVDADGAVIAACPPEGVLIEGMLFECTLAPGATVPSTTIPAEAP